MPTWNVPCTDGGDVAECNIASDLPYSLNAPADLFADVHARPHPGAATSTSANAVVNKIVGYENTPPAPAGDDFYTPRHGDRVLRAEVPLRPERGSDAASRTASRRTARSPGHYELDYTNHKDTRGFTQDGREDPATRWPTTGLTVDRVYTKVDDDVIPELYYDGDSDPRPTCCMPGFPWNGTGADLLAHYNDGPLR